MLFVLTHLFYLSFLALKWIFGSLNRLKYWNKNLESCWADTIEGQALWWRRFWRTSWDTSLWLCHSLHRRRTILRTTLIGKSIENVRSAKRICWAVMHIILPGKGWGSVHMVKILSYTRPPAHTWHHQEQRTDIFLLSCGF